jgi:hypothetical protein
MTDAGFTFEHDETRRRVVITLSARATTEVWRTTISTFVSRDVWGQAVIYDMSAVDSAPLLVNLPNLARIVEELMITHGRPGPVAVVVAPAEVALWRQRISHVFRDFLTVEVFSDVASADAWLDQTAG